MALPKDLADLDFCYLTTIGRMSGKDHEIEIWFATEGPVIYLLAGARDRSDWVRNLVQDPQVSVRIGERVLRARAEVIADEAERLGAAGLVFRKYQPRHHSDLTGWRDSALPIAVRLTD